MCIYIYIYTHTCIQEDRDRRHAARGDGVAALGDRAPRTPPRRAVAVIPIIITITITIICSTVIIIIIITITTTIITFVPRKATSPRP